LQSYAVLAVTGLALMRGAALADGGGTLEVDLAHPVHAIPPNFCGLMTEEINHSYDGGLFAELIQNRTFQDPGSKPGGLPIHWSAIGSAKAATETADPVNAALPVTLRLDLTGDTASIANDGYWGIPVRPGTTYTASFYAKSGNGFSGPVTASIVADEGGATLAKGDSAAITGDWKKYRVTLKTGADAPTTAKAKFVLSATGSGSVAFSLVSLFPPTYQNTLSGLRPDLMQLMAALHPKFIRLPGGNYVEGDHFPTRFDWKKMIGPADERPGHMGCWSYRSSDGFGLPQFLLWCKQLGAEPVLAVFAGYTLDRHHMDAGSPEMAQYTQEALEEIEYVSGPADSEWGKRRAADGFPEPFPLHYVEIGNEDFADRSGSYDGRFTEIANAIRAKYPQLKLIATAPVKSVKPDLYDDHFYPSPAQMMNMYGQYDTENNRELRNGQGGRRADGTHIFVGEWASRDVKGPTSDMRAALSDAVWLLGLERNSDVVDMECYAPLLANVNPADPAQGYGRAWQWPVNLIGYDALRSYGSPSYYMQTMYGQNMGDVVLPAKLDAMVAMAPTKAPAAPTPHGGVGVGTWETQAEFKDLEVTAANGTKLSSDTMASDPARWHFTGGDWNVANGVVSPKNGTAPTWAVTGDPGWTDYTIRLKARKISGSEGFLVLWHALDDDNYFWWNIGGWRNTGTGAMASTGGSRGAFGPTSSFTVETNRWYDLRLEIRGRHMKGYIDGVLVTDAENTPPPQAPSLFATASYSNADHNVIVKVVNAGAGPLDLAIHLLGAGDVSSEGTATVLTGDLSALNSCEQPMNVAPKTQSLTNLSASFTRTFPAHSFTILRFPAKKG